MAEFNMEQVKVENAELPKVQRGRTRSIESNPFLGPLGDSYNSNTGRSVKVPNEHVKEAVYLIRRAADDLGIGARVVTSLTKDEQEKAAKNKMVEIKFQGKDRAKRKPKAERALAENAGVVPPVANPGANS